MASRTAFVHFSRANYLLPRPQNISRSLSSTSRLTYPRKDSQDKDSIKADATEYSKSGTDDGAANQQDAAFDPKTTSPEKEKNVAGEGEGQGNPLEFSPANKDISKGTTKGGTENSGKE